MTSALDDEDLSMTISAPQGPRSFQDGTEFNGSAAQQRQPPNPPPNRAAMGPRQSKGLDRLGHYNVIKTLGEGSFGKVKLAIHQSTGQKVALKIISRRKLITRDMAGRIEREIQYLQLLRHPHIIKLFTVITMPGEIVMVLEYAGGELFDYIVQNGKMAEGKARKFFQQIVCAVEYCHRHKIVHRDLKPENLLLDEQLNVKIADFGLSNIMTDGNFLKTSCGSPNYAAPEVISGKLYAGPEVDVWSCGVILYVLLVGRLPFDDEYIPALFKKITQGNYVVPSYLSQGAVQLIRRMLQVNPVNRITIQEIRQDPWFTHDLAEYLQPPVEEFVDTGVDPNKAIDPHSLGKGNPVIVQEKLHSSVVGKLGKTMGYAPDDVQEALCKDEPSAIKDAYLIVRENHIMKTNPSLQQDQPEFMAQSPPAFPSSLPMSPHSVATPRPAPTPLTNMDHPRHGSTGSSFIIEARSPASTIAVLPSSMPDYHTAYMNEQTHPTTSPAAGGAGEDAASEENPRSQAEQEVTARRLKPHSKSSSSLHRSSAHAKLEPLTPHAPTTEKAAKKPKTLKWQFGIRSRNSPPEAMLAIYRALHKMGAQWEVPTPKEPGTGSREDSAERARDDGGSQSPEYSDSDPEPGTDPEYATHSEQEARRRRRRAEREVEANGTGARCRDRLGRWNDYGYVIPEDPWVIRARFRKAGMWPLDVAHPWSTHSSRVDLRDGQFRAHGSVASSAAGSMDNIATAAVAATPAGPTGSHAMARWPVVAEESAWVYVTIQLYSIEKEFYLVDFKCAGYELLMRRFAREVQRMKERSDVVRRDTAEGDEDDDYDDESVLEDEGTGEQLVGAGRSAEEKEISSPFPFLDVASRLIIQLAEAQD